MQIKEENKRTGSMETEMAIDNPFNFMKIEVDWKAGSEMHEQKLREKKLLAQNLQ